MYIDQSGLPHPYNPSTVFLAYQCLLVQNHLHLPMNGKNNDCALRFIHEKLAVTEDWTQGLGPEQPMLWLELQPTGDLAILYSDVGTECFGRTPIHLHAVFFTSSLASSYRWVPLGGAGSRRQNTSPSSELDQSNVEKPVYWFALFEQGSKVLVAFFVLQWNFARSADKD